jgi:hypothetical protein
MPLSNKQVVSLGGRLAAADVPLPADLDLLADVLIDYNDALDVVVAGLRSIGLEATTRLKTSGTSSTNFAASPTSAFEPFEIWPELGSSNR